MKPKKSAIESNSKIGMGPSLYYGHRGGWVVQKMAISPKTFKIPYSREY